MSKFEGAEKIGLRNKETGKLLAVYPFKPEGTDDEINKTVRDWYYMLSCSAEEEIREIIKDIVIMTKLICIQKAVKV